jgi:hypothetical protein
MKFTLLFLTVLATSAMGFGFHPLKDSAGKVKINYIVDMQLKYYVDALLNSTYALPDFVGPDASLVGVTVSGVNTLVRKGDNYITIDGPTSTLTSEGTFGLASMVLHVNEFTMAGQTGKTDITIANNALAFHVTTTVTASSCSASIDSAVVTEASGVTTSSDNPALDGLDITDFTQNTVVPYINQQLTTDAEKAKIYAIINPCLDRY